MSTFVIEDELHCEQSEAFPTLEAAVAEVRRLAKIAWNEPPNTAPCMSWRTCGRRYLILEYEDGDSWKVLVTLPAMNISAAGREWLLAGYELE